MTVLQTPVNGFPYPDLNENADVPSDIQALAMALDPMGYVPVGAVMLWIATAAPTGWLILNGQVVSAATYPKLAQMFGQSGDNVTLPDMRDVFPVGASATNAVNGTGGAASVALTTNHLPAHDHHVSTNAGKTGGADRSLAHGHSITGVIAQPASPYKSNNFNSYQPQGGYTAVDSWANAANSGLAQPFTADSASTPDHFHTIASVGGDQAHENRPPFRAVNFIIRAG